MKKRAFTISILFIIMLLVCTGCSKGNNSSASSQAKFSATQADTNLVQKTLKPKPTPVPTPLPKPTTEEEALAYLIENIGIYKNYSKAWLDTIDFKSDNVVVLNNYASARYLTQATNFFDRNTFIALFNPDYVGIFADEVKAFCLKYADIVYDKYAKIGDLENGYAKMLSGENVGANVYKINQEKVKALNEIDTRKSPWIGMTGAEVRGSTWGSPDKINRTITAHGISEQWVYPMYDAVWFIYLEDGIVTAIQN